MIRPELLQLEAGLPRLRLRRLLNRQLYRAAERLRLFTVGQRASGWPSGLAPARANEIAIIAGASLSFVQCALQLLDVPGKAFNVAGEFLPVIIFPQ